MNRIFLVISFVFWSLLAVAQSPKQKQLEAQKAQIQKEIAAFRSLLKDEKKKEKSVLSQLAEQKARILLSEKLISTTAKQKRLLEDDIYLTQLKINKLKRELKVLKEDYAKTIVKSYKSRNDKSRIMFVLSSQNFLQAYKRIQYMKQYASYRKMQGEEIAEKQAKLNIEKARLEKNKKEKEKVLAENKKEKELLEEQKKEQEKLVKEVQKNKKKYVAEIDKKQKKAREIDKQIKKLIAEAIAKANKKNAPKGTKSSSSKFVLTPEGKIVSDNFKANKGKLPWPVVEGYVQQGYGNYQDPVYKGVTHMNTGVEIATKPGANARAVFGGEVLRIQVIKGSNKKAIYIQHGDFISIYHNMETVLVKEGQKVDIKDSLGKVFTDSSGKAILKFYLTQNITTLDPSQWINGM